MKIREGQGVVTVEGLRTIVSVRACVWDDQRTDSDVWPVLRVQAQTVERDATLHGTGRPVKYVQSGEDVLLFPVPDGPYWLEIVYHGEPRRC